jgi:hypothetical protein
MLIYTLDPLYLTKTGVIEEFESVVWTERFIEAGEAVVVMGATHENAVKLRPGTMLLHEESDEPMLIETRDIKDGVITANAKTIEACFERYVGPLGRGGLASNIIRYVAYNMQNRQEGRFAFPNLRVQDFVDDTGNQVNQEEHIFGFEKAHDALLRLGKKYSKGIAVRRMLKDETQPWMGYELVFVVRDPTDRTQPGPDYLRLSPNDDNFVDIDELYSLQDKVDVVIVHVPKPFAQASGTDTETFALAWAPMSYPDKTDQGGPENFTLGPGDNPFDWRIVEITADDIDMDFIRKRIDDYWFPTFGGAGMPPTWTEMDDTQREDILRAEMKAKAKEEWHKSQANEKIVFDGQIPGELLKYGRDYRLGDIVVAEANFTGGRQTKMVTEYIRSSDQNGTRSYPTLASPLDPYDEGDSGGWSGTGG